MHLEDMCTPNGSTSSQSFHKKNFWDFHFISQGHANQNVVCMVMVLVKIKFSLSCLILFWTCVWDVCDQSTFIFQCWHHWYPDAAEKLFSITTLGV